MDAGIPDSGPVLAIDWGERHIGIAVSDPTQTIAHPLTTITRRTGRRFPMQKLQPILQERSPVGVVFGLPLAPDGSETESCREVRQAAQLLHDKRSLPVAFIDERMTTARAHAGRRELAKAEKGAVDAVAAAIILQNFMDGRS